LSNSSKSTKGAPLSVSASALASCPISLPCELSLVPTRTEGSVNPAKLMVYNFRFKAWANQRTEVVFPQPVGPTTKIIFKLSRILLFSSSNPTCWLKTASISDKTSGGGTD